MPTPRLLLILPLALALGACGGGGGAGDSVLPTQVSISSANRDQVAQATAAAVLGLGATNSGLATPASSNGTDAQRLDSGNTGIQAHPLVHTAQLTGWLPTRARLKASSLLQAGTVPARRALAVIGPVTEACSLSGTMSFTVDDADNNEQLSVGDKVLLVFNDCQDSASELLRGSMQFSYTQISNATDFVARVTMTALSVVQGADSITVSGQMLLAQNEPSAQQTRTLLTVEQALVATVQSGGNRDTVTMDTGFTEQTVYDDNVQPPEGGPVRGRSLATLNGRVVSSRLGGWFQLSTPVAVQAFDHEAYPRAGVLQANGVGSALRLTVLDATQVQLQLDADGNGQYETTTTVSWTSLI
jgi:hypothetical protein